MGSSTEETTADYVSIDHDQQEETTRIISTPLSDYTTAPRMSKLGSSSFRLWSSRMTSDGISMTTSAATTTPKRTTTDFPRPTYLGPVQTTSVSPPMTSATTNAAYNSTASDTVFNIGTSQQIPTGASSASPDHPAVNATTIAGGVAGVVGLLILVLLLKVYLRQRKIIKERDILMMSMYLTPRQTPLKKDRFKCAASKDEINKEEDVTEQDRDSYMEPLVHRQIWKLKDRSPVIPGRTEETNNELDTMYSSIRISENTAQRLQYIARCMGPTDATLKKQSITVNADYSHVKAPGAKQIESDHGQRWSTDTNHYERVEGSTVDETEAEDTVIYDDVIIEQTERLRYTKPQRLKTTSMQECLDPGAR